MYMNNFPNIFSVAYGPTKQFIIADILKTSLAPRNVVLQVVNYHYYRIDINTLNWIYYFDFFSHLLLNEIYNYITTCRVVESK